MMKFSNKESWFLKAHFKTLVQNDSADRTENADKTENNKN